MGKDQNTTRLRGKGEKPASLEHRVRKFKSSFFSVSLPSLMAKLSNPRQASYFINYPANSFKAQMMLGEKTDVKSACLKEISESSQFN